MNTSEQKIRALIIDDSPTDQQTLSYLLTKRLNCHVEIASDGLEGLDKLSRQRFSVIFLDMLMPMMNGNEVLREIRACSEAAQTPVVIISGQADPELVKSVLKMGVYDYILKPYNKDGVIKRLATTFERIKAEMEEYAVDDPLTQDGRPVVLIADTDNNFRHFVASTLADKFNVIQATSGAIAVGLALKHRPQWLLAGPKQGILSREKMIQKLRSAKKLEGLKIFAVDGTDKQETSFDSNLFDGSVPRTFLPDAFRKVIEEITASHEPLQTKASGMLEQLKPALVSATEQVFGMMMSAEVTAAAAAVVLAPDAPAIVARICLNGYSEERKLAITFSCGIPCADALAKRMLGEEKVAENSEFVQGALGEVMNVIGGRLQTTLDEQGRAFILGLPRVETRPAAELTFAGACLTHFAGEGDLKFSIAMATSRCPTVKIMKADIKEGLVLSQPIQIENVQPLPKGLQLNAETVAQLKEQGPDEIEIFEPM